MVTHAIDVEGYSFDQLVARAGEARTIKAQMLAASRRALSNPAAPPAYRTQRE